MRTRYFSWGPHWLATWQPRDKKLAGTGFTVWVTMTILLMDMRYRWDDIFDLSVWFTVPSSIGIMITPGPLFRSSHDAAMALQLLRSLFNWNAEMGGHAATNFRDGSPLSLCSLYSRNLDGLFTLLLNQKGEVETLVSLILQDNKYLGISK